MFKKILWATDGSDAADLALPVVKQLSAEGGAEVVVFHSDIRMVGPRSYGYPVYIDEAELKAKIRNQAQELRDGGTETEVDIVSATSIGGAAHEIAEAAQRNGADLIVAGSRGHTLLGGLLLGSVTQRLLHIANCPVLIVPVEMASRTRAAAATGATTGAAFPDDMR